MGKVYEMTLQITIRPLANPLALLKKHHSYDSGPAPFSFSWRTKPRICTNLLRIYESFRCLPHFKKCPNNIQVSRHGLSQLSVCTPVWKVGQRLKTGKLRILQILTSDIRFTRWQILTVFCRELSLKKKKKQQVKLSEMYWQHIRK